MITNLKTPPPPTQNDDDSDEGDERPSVSFDLDSFEEMVLPPKLKKLTQCVIRSRCEGVCICKFRDGWFLLWDERHAENVTQIEYVTGKVGQREAREAWFNASAEEMAGEWAKRRAHKRLYDVTRYVPTPSALALRL
jgi:hypothetical protein